jgi:DNA topoisomerase-3
MLILCEKPSVAKDFARALGAAGKKGYYQGGDTVITYCVGHLFELFPPEGYDPKYKKWSLENLPIIPPSFRYRLNESTADQAECVLQLLHGHAQDDVLIATDAGREGELIARIALLEAGITDLSRFRRFWVSEALTPEVIHRGILEAKPLSEYNALSLQAFARQRADWLVGMNLSQYMSVGNPPPPFSVGRVQTAVLAAVFNRSKEIKDFVPVPYKELEAAITSIDGITVKALLENPKTGKTSFFAEDNQYVEVASSTCRDKPVDTVDVTSKQKSLKPPKLLNITGLQKEAFKRFGFKPEDTLNLVQSLYETHKCLSYPRTPSRVMGDSNVDLFREKFELLKADFPGSSYCDPSLISSKNTHIFCTTQLEDHHALIPLAPLPDSATDKERKVYSIVLESFFTVCMPDFVFNEKSLRFHIGSYSFISTIREVIQPGWKKLKSGETQDEDENIAEVPSFNEKGCTLTGLHIKNLCTKPKKEFAIDTLLAFMEHPRGEEDQKLAGLGTPATRADIIKKLFAREYLTEEKKKLLVTDRGRFLLGRLSGHHQLLRIADVATTTEWEQQLVDDPAIFEKNIILFVTECVKADPGRPVFQKKPLGKCPLCGKPVVETRAGYGCSGYKDEPKCSFIIWKTIAGAPVSPTDASLLLIGQKTPVKKCKNKEGKPFQASFVLEGAKDIKKKKK